MTQLLLQEDSFLTQYRRTGLYRLPTKPQGLSKEIQS